ncbi:hypothetical protein RHGRI_036375 [Rhododendron griersonianum]|uniref:RING-type E3 ubiquitin transferase n=1 Tax=Rhododendron griersonianum TaxID=479676 RepID=A0AAV6HN76_9ERIC|nr:hypothetical protein RHGRI_036375 [Rhododendron griersonianum]
MELVSPAPPPDRFSGFSPPPDFGLGFVRTSRTATFQVPEIVEESGSGGGVVHVAVGKSVGKAVALLDWTLRRGKATGKSSKYRSGNCIQEGGERADAKTSIQLLEHMQSIKGSLLFYFPRVVLFVKASKVVTEASQVEKGIVDLVNKHGIRKLVIGAVPENCMKVKAGSSKANYAAKNAPRFCEIQFVNKGKHLWTREACEGSSFGNGEVAFNPECLQPSSGGSIICAEVRNEDQAEAVPTEVLSTPTFPSSMNRLSLPYFHSFSSPSSTSSSSGYASSTEQMVSSDSATKVDEESLHAQLTEIQREAEASRAEALQEFLKHKNLEAEAVEAISKVKALESARALEVKLRKEAEDALEMTIQEQEKLNDEREEVSRELQRTMRNIALLDSRAQEANRRREEASGELKTLQSSISALRHEKQKIRRQKMEATRWLDRWKSRGQAGGATYNGLIGFTEGSPEVVEFSLTDLQTATCNFSESFKIGQSGHGCVYKGEMLDRTVAIKKLHPRNLQRQSDFEQEVQVLGKLQHPHLVTLIGICPEAWSLVYEYLPNGSLQDCLFKRNNICSLNWKIRAKIIAEISSALLFLHSCESEDIVHGNLKPENVLLGSDLSCKLCDFAISRLMPEETLRCPSFRRDTELKGALSYTDPESHRTGSLSTKSDIYSFGLIVLQLLTGRDPVGLAGEVRKAVSFGKLTTVLDSSAGEWPNFVSKKLVYLGLQCCELNSRDRPELTPSLVRELERLHTSEERPVPSFFLCPILQEIMHDPQVAADGFTYERDALIGWLENGRETSPMTNLKLDHLHLTPNHALRHAIQDWLCKS